MVVETFGFLNLFGCGCLVSLYEGVVLTWEQRFLPSDSDVLAAATIRRDVLVTALYSECTSTREDHRSLVALD